MPPRKIEMKINVAIPPEGNEKLKIFLFLNLKKLAIPPVGNKNCNISFMPPRKI
jgi:hypothetical protein